MAAMAFQLVSCDETNDTGVKESTVDSVSTGQPSDSKTTEKKSEDTVIDDTEKDSDINGKSTEENTEVLQDGQINYDFQTQYSEKDLESNWSESDCTLISASDSGFEISGTGAKAENTTLEITEAGTYLLRGSIKDGNILINSNDTKAVRLVFDNFSISCSYDSPLKVPVADKVIITLADGTKNYISDTLRTSTGAEDEATGAVYCQSNLTFNGNGTLDVDAKFADGIVSKDKLRIVSGNINVTSADDGLVGRDLFALKDGSIKVTSLGDGVKSTYDKDTEKGQIIIEGGFLDITSEKDGIQSENILLINGGNIKIMSGGGSENGEVHRDDMMGGGFGRGQNAAQATQTETESRKGMKSPYFVGINGGTTEINSADDAVHSDKDIIVNDGTIKLESGDDGLHAEILIEINGGVLDVSKSYEGVEAQYIEVNGGENNISSDDDGFNASSSDYSAEMTLTFNGGNTYVDAYGDGLDSNGNVYINEGVVLVSGPVNNGNGALDCGDRNNEIIINGGTLVAAGSSGMFELPSETSTQNIVAISSLSMTPGMACTLVDKNQKELISFDIKKDSQAIAISTPDIKTGESYTLCLKDGSSVSEAATFEIASTLTVSGTFMGMGGGFGGGRPGGGMKFEGEMPFPDGEMPERPSFDGEMPERPSFDGEMPERPSFDGEMPERPSFDGEIPEDMPFPDGQMRPKHNGGMKQMPETTTAVSMA